MNYDTGEWVYAPGKKNVKCWRAKLRGESTVVVEHKTGEKGQIVEHVYNISEGKQNRSPREQAIFEINSKYKKQLDKGYKEDLPLPTDMKTNTLSEPMPMLAHVASPKIYDSGSEEYAKIKDSYVQPKLDGHRAIIRVNIQKQEALMYSRRGKVITTMPHVLEQAVDMFCNEKWKLEFIGHDPKHVYVDGELYIHGMPLQDIGSLIKKEQKDSVKVSFWAYDLFSVDPSCYMHMSQAYAFRKDHLEVAFELKGFKHEFDSLGDFVKAPLMLTPTIYPDHGLGARKNGADFNKHLEDAEALGFEGIMLREQSMEYLVGQRSRFLQKVKSFDDSDYKIVNIKKSNKYPGRTPAIFICVNDNGDQFEVFAPGALTAKEYFYIKRDQYIGKTVTVKHKGLTKKGLPWHPVALHIRDDV